MMQSLGLLADYREHRSSLHALHTTTVSAKQRKPGDAPMFTKTIFALITAIVLSVSFVPTANAQCGHGDRDNLSAYPTFNGC
jgi:hypothetical protein